MRTIKNIIAVTLTLLVIVTASAITYAVFIARTTVMNVDAATGESGLLPMGFDWALLCGLYGMLIVAGYQFASFIKK